MTGVGSIAKGYDPEYYTQVSKGPEYYSASAGLSGMEPAGIWKGRGGLQLGLIPGDEIDPAVFNALYKDFADPRNPDEHLGSKPYDWHKKYEKFLALEPEATAKRRRELRDQAKRETRLSVNYWDYTFSPSKDITLMHASFSWNAVLAKDCGFDEEAAYWQQAADAVWASVWKGTDAALAYIQDHAGQTRSGHHGRLPSGKSVGMWEAADLVVGSFAQHTSRAGDPQLHVHNVILNKVFRVRDEAWTALDGDALTRHFQAATAHGVLVMENELLREFGVLYEYSEEARGRLVKGVSRSVIDQYSKRRRRDIEPDLKSRIEEFKRQYGHEPDARALSDLRLRANKSTRKPKPDAEPDQLEAYVREWASEARLEAGMDLGSLGPSVTNRKGPGSDELSPAGGFEPDPGAPARPALTPGQTQRLMAGALELLEAKSTSFRLPDLQRALGELLPAYMPVLDDDRAMTLLGDLAQRVLAGETGPVICLEAPDLAGEVPARFRNADGSSMFRAHNAEQYATANQMSREERIASLAASRGRVPVIEPDRAAQLLGASRAELESQLDHETGADIWTKTGSGLRLEQAAAAFRLATSPRRAELMIGPAGTGKTTTVARLAKMWRAEHPSARVIGLATSQVGANVLREAGVSDSWNIDRFFGVRYPDAPKPLPGSRAALKLAQQARDRENVPAGSLIIVDEASMTSMTQFDTILQFADRHACKVAVVGDPYQLGAVESPGTMMMLARRFGFVQLSEAQRFNELWERDASLRLREGDKTVLTEYNLHGRFRYGIAEDMIEQAYRMWVADYVAGKRSALITHNQATADELSRRARGDLLHFRFLTGDDGAVRLVHDGDRDGRDVVLQGGVRANVGDRIMARENDHKLKVGAGNRTLTNRDEFEVVSTQERKRTPGQQAQLARARQADAGKGWDRQKRWLGEVKVRLILEPDADGNPQYGQPFWIGRAYLRKQGHLAYGRTTHATEGQTFDGASYSVISANDDRKTLYTAMTRGRETNIAFVIGEPELPDAYGAPSPDPEIARQRILDAERRGDLVPPRVAAKGNLMAALGDILDRYDPQLTAGELQQQNLSDADHLADLGNRYFNIAKMMSVQRYEQVLQGQMSADTVAYILHDESAWALFRELRTAEAAGLDGDKVLRDAVNSRDFGGANSYAKVLHGRIHKNIRNLPPKPGRSFTDRVPSAGTCDPGSRAYLLRVAELMDERVQRLGEHVAETMPLWARRAMGPVPDDPTEAADWRERAGHVAAYRELHGYDNPGDPIGPEPARTDPEARENYHNALHALGRIDGMDLMHVRDEVLETRRGLVAQELAWAPEDVSEQLRLARIAEADARLQAERAAAEARVAADPGQRTENEINAAIWAKVGDKAGGMVRTFEPVQEVAEEYERVTEPTIREGKAADVELHRRHPERQYGPLVPPGAGPQRGYGYAPPQDHPGDQPVPQPEPEAEPEPVVPDGWAGLPPPVEPDWREASHDADWDIVQKYLPVPEPSPAPEPLPQAEPEADPDEDAEPVSSAQEDARLLSELGLTPETVDQPEPEFVRHAREAARETGETLALLKSMPEPGDDPDNDIEPGPAWPDEHAAERDSVLQLAHIPVEPSPQFAEPEPSPRADPEPEAGPLQ